jgi:hypothetical protein
MRVRGDTHLPFVRSGGPIRSAAVVETTRLPLLLLTVSTRLWHRTVMTARHNS